MNTTWTFPGTPQPPDWSLDFDALLHRFDWLAKLADCPQDPEWHAEGNVLIHTRMVIENLIAMPEWRALPAPERTVVFAATLLHDVSKPAQTRVEEGRIRSKGHAREGAIRTRLLFMTDFPEIPFDMREQIVALVRHHGLPAYFLERPDPIRALLSAATVARLDLLCILATADARGRAMKSTDDMPDRVNLFRDFALEHHCLTAPYPFANDHSRFLYFHDDALLPTDQRYDDTRSRVTLMSGLPATGKDTWIRYHAPDTPLISLDDIRTELDIHPADDQSAVIAAAKEQARLHLRAGSPFIWNATNTTRFLRDPLIQFFADYKAHIQIIYCESPLPEIQTRNLRRPHPVPAQVYETLLTKLEIPNLTESHTLTLPVPSSS